MSAWSTAFALEVLPALLDAFRITVGVTLAGTAVATIVGLVLALLRSGPAFVGLATRWLVDFIRGTPLLVQLFFLYYALPDLGLKLGPWTAGVVALGLHYGSYMSEAYRAGIEAVPKGQWEAARVLGFGPRQTWTRVILPQAVPRVLPALGNYAIAMFKETPLLAVLTLVEVLGAARIVGSETGRYLEPMTLVGVLFLAVSLLAAYGLRRLEAWLRPRVGLA